ncbi:MFS general substrate transporter [Microthyrium microscopicum]|uniref:MFS general substrate transporter n=1 Tax=Microthyrium microscopicum TaxID=703497 RepID=A0A6A6ULN4_9PEZI|nr:MFS general substrate transporter [Microthyrium microscopicum]
METSNPALPAKETNPNPADSDPRLSISSDSTGASSSHDAPARNLEKRPSGLSRSRSRRSDLHLERVETAISRIRSRRPIGPFSHPLTHTQTQADVLVTFDGPDDPYNPLNWAFKKKVITTFMYGLTTMGITFASSVYSPTVIQVAEEFRVGQEVSTLGLSVLLVGFGVGPLLWAPLSEVYGRKPAVLIPYFIAAIFSLATAVSKDIQTVVISRFFTGFFGSAPITNTGGVLGDLWSAEVRGVAVLGYAMAVIGGPTLAPIVGSAITQSSLGWRWTEYITFILMMFLLLMDVILLDESYPAVLLVHKARRLRYESGNWALHAKHEEWDVSLRELGEKYLIRPFQLLCTPICLLVALYASFVYGILYANLGAFPIVFEELRGWNQLVGSLPFLAVLIGICLGGVVNYFNQKYYLKRYKQAGNRPVPEARLPPMMFGSVFFSIGLFIFAWTADPKFHWIAPVIGAVCFGLGFFTIFQAALNYLIDTFQKYSASAVAANTFIRSSFAAAFPLFITPMLHNMGVSWGISVFGFISIALIPIPYLFFIYGKRLRARGVWSKESV